MCFAVVEVATALQYLCRSGLKVWVQTWNGNPIWIKCGRLSQIPHSSARFATCHIHTAQAVFPRRIGEAGDCMLQGCDDWSWCIFTVERVCRWHVVCKMIVKEETGDAAFGITLLLSSLNIQVRDESHQGLRGNTPAILHRQRWPALRTHGTLHCTDCEW